MATGGDRVVRYRFERRADRRHLWNRAV